MQIVNAPVMAKTVLSQLMKYHGEGLYILGDGYFNYKRKPARFCSSNHDFQDLMKASQVYRVTLLMGDSNKLTIMRPDFVDHGYVDQIPYKDQRHIQSQPNIHYDFNFRKSFLNLSKVSKPLKAMVRTKESPKAPQISDEKVDLAIILLDGQENVMKHPEDLGVAFNKNLHNDGLIVVSDNEYLGGIYNKYGKPVGEQNEFNGYGYQCIKL